MSDCHVQSDHTSLKVVQQNHKGEVVTHRCCILPHMDYCSLTHLFENEINYFSMLPVSVSVVTTNKYEIYLDIWGYLGMLYIMTYGSHKPHFVPFLVY